MVFSFATNYAFACKFCLKALEFFLECITLGRTIKHRRTAFRFTLLYASACPLSQACLHEILCVCCLSQPHINGKLSAIYIAQGAPDRVRSWTAHENWLKPPDFTAMLHEKPFSVLLNCHEWKVCSCTIRLSWDSSLTAHS